MTWFDRELVVDGIVSRRDAESFIRDPMIDIRLDHRGDPPSWYRQRWDLPPWTDEEVDQYLKSEEC